MSARLEFSEAGRPLGDALSWIDLESIFSQGDGQVVAESRTSQTIRIELPRGDGAVYLKRYLYPRFYWRHALRMSRARREWRSLQQLAELGLPVPTPVAWGEERRYRRLLRGFVATLAVPGGRSLQDALVEDSASGSMAEARLARRLGRLVAYMHRVDFAHGDLFLRNIVVEGTLQRLVGLYLIDAPRGRMGASPARRLLDLASLDLDAFPVASSRARALCLRAYVREQGGRREDADLAQRIETLRERLRARRARKLARRATAVALRTPG